MLLTQQFKLRCQQPNCWKRENPEASAPPLPLKSSIPTKIASLGYITALSFLLLTSKTFFLYCLDANCTGFVLFSLQLFSLSFSFSSSPPPPLYLKYWKSCLKRSRCLQFFGLVFSECSKPTVMLAVRSVLFLNCLLQLSKFREASSLCQYITSPSFHGAGKRLSPPLLTQVCLLRRAKKQLPWKSVTMLPQPRLHR